VPITTGSAQPPNRLSTKRRSRREYLHARGIAHRDIKPNNILFRRPVQEGIEAVLVDFGLAQRQRARGLEAGTLLYMAPEQIEQERGGTARPDPRPADIYALGVVLYRMVTGRLPFEGRDRDQRDPQEHADPPVGSPEGDPGPAG